MNRLAGFARAEDGVSIIEFAVILPVLLVLLLAGNQVVLYINATRKVQQVATSVSEMLTQATASSGSTATVNATDLNFSYDAAMVIFPYAMTDARRQGIGWRNGLTVSMASISFKKNNNTCVGADLSPCYDARVDWTSTGTSNAAYRPCGTLQAPVDNGASYSRTSLPRSLYGPGSIIAVDVIFTFNPTFGSGLVKALTIERSAFVQPRYVDAISFDATNTDGIATLCPSTS